MRQSILSILGASALMTATAISAGAFAQTPGAPDARGKSGVNVGSLNCHVSGGVGFIFGSSKDLECLFARTDGLAEPYHGEIKKFGIDIGFTKEAHVVWLVFAPGTIARGALAGEYTGATASATVVVGVGANVLVGGSSQQITLQPVSVEGSVGLNVAAGVGDIVLAVGH